MPEPRRHDHGSSVWRRVEGGGVNRARLGGAVAGGVVAGLGITAMLLFGERKSGQPSELVQLERTTAWRVGADTPPPERLPDTREQALVQGGHLLLSATAAAAYVVAFDEEAGVVPSGVAFGLAFYAAMHWITGPLLGVKRPEWRSDTPTVAMHTLNHVAFGLATAMGARIARHS